MKILLTGGSGLLGSQLVSLLKDHTVDAPTHAEMDICKELIPRSCDLIIHCAAYKDVIKAETNKKECSRVNIGGTLNLLTTYADIPFVFISSEYAKNPLNHYAETKAIGESLTKLYARSYLIIRTVFKPNPFPWDRAFIDQYTQGDYIDVIAPLIVKAIMKWDLTSETIYVGTGRKTIFELAQRTRPAVQPCSIEDIKEAVLPHDYL